MSEWRTASPGFSRPNRGDRVLVVTEEGAMELCEYDGGDRQIWWSNEDTGAVLLWHPAPPKPTMDEFDQALRAHRLG